MTADPEQHDQMASTTASLARLRQFRTGFHSCLTGWGDALFELGEALLTAPGPVASVPALSLEPVFRRSHGSLYKALARGGVDDEQIRDLLVALRPHDWPDVFAVDASTWPRCDAETSPGRGFYYSASKHSAGQPIVAGWSYQWVTQLSWASDSWTAPVDMRRAEPGDDVTTMTATQVRELTARLAPSSQSPTFVFDAGYDPIGLTHELADTAAVLVVRIRDDRVFHTDPPPPSPGKPGRPRRHGQRRSCAKPADWPTPDEQLTAEDRRYGTVHVSAWHHLHPKLGRRGRWAGHAQAPIVRGTILRVEVQHLPKPTSRTKKTLWLWVAAGADAHRDLDICWRAYLRRFDIEHTYRFVKNTLGWTTPRICTPEQADTWTWTIIAAYTQLRLARGLVEDHRLPWERPRPRERLTPGRVRRGFRRLGPLLGTPASPPKPSRAGPGRPKNTPTGPRARHPAIKKSA